MEEKNYLFTEVEKIITDEKNYPYPQNLAMSSAWILGNLKGVNLNIYDMDNKSSVCDFTVIGYATNYRQAQAMAQEIDRQMKKRGIKVNSIEGSKEADWTLVDLGDVIIHIVLETSRENYSLEQLWSECPKVNIPSEYYFSDDASTESSSNEYF
jgi:ribosome-associated protein